MLSKTGLQFINTEYACIMFSRSSRLIEVQFDANFSAKEGAYASLIKTVVNGDFNV